MYILPIIGIIGEPSKGEENLPHFRFTDLLMHLNAVKDEQIIHLIINSDGGCVDEGSKIKAALIASGKSIITSNSGNVASMAVDLFLIPKEKINRKFNPDKGVFLIHNPWAAIEGDSELMNEASKHLKSLENEFAKEYANITGTEKSILEGFMSENKPLTPEQIDSLGFATIEKQEFKAVAKFNINKNNKMEIKELEIKELEKKVSGFEKIMKQIHEKLFPKSVKKLMIQDVNGSELDFGAEIETTEQIQVGVKATVDGKPAEGEYTIEDGDVYVFAAGELTEIKVPESDMEALKKENTELKAELETLKTSNTEAIAKVEAENTEFKAKALKVDEIKKEFETFKNQFSDFKTQNNLSQSEKNNRKKTKFSYKEKTK